MDPTTSSPLSTWLSPFTTRRGSCCPARRRSVASSIRCAAGRSIRTRCTTKGTIDTFSESTATPGRVAVSVTANGDFSYTPPDDFVGTDTFNYTFTNIGSSPSALVTINVIDPVTGFAVTAKKRRERGVWYVDLVWVNYTGETTVTITRTINGGGATDLGRPNDGDYSVNDGKKPAGGEFVNEVCEDDTGACATSNPVSL
ncbi:MAG: hypothetical protein KJO33_13930 [Gammaproteobacteria bacterium]|nr:hypothetical protein [Gammaproteobacteria bacterium]NNK33975.1 hypothetical protein [Xanthomonadales bacterium]